MGKSKPEPTKYFADYKSLHSISPVFCCWFRLPTTRTTVRRQMMMFQLILWKNWNTAFGWHKKKIVSVSFSIERKKNQISNSVRYDESCRAISINCTKILHAIEILFQFSHLFCRVFSPQILGVVGIFTKRSKTNNFKIMLVAEFFLRNAFPATSHKGVHSVSCAWSFVYSIRSRRLVSVIRTNNEKKLENIEWRKCQIWIFSVFRCKTSRHTRILLVSLIRPQFSNQHRHVIACLAKECHTHHSNVSSIVSDPIFFFCPTKILICKLMLDHRRFVQQLIHKNYIIRSPQHVFFFVRFSSTSCQI